MPKTVDHDARRQQLADAACRVIARRGLADTTLALIAEDSGWSIGSIRHYFPNKDELIAAALWRVGERLDERIRRRVGDRMTLTELRIAMHELLPLDANRREEARVHLAFLARAAVEPALAEASEDAARRLQKPLAARVAYAVQSGELPAHLDAEHEAARIRLLLAGLTVQLITTPKRTSTKWALRVVDEHLAALATGPPPASSRPTPLGAGGTGLQRAPDGLPARRCAAGGSRMSTSTARSATSGSTASTSDRWSTPS